MPSPGFQQGTTFTGPLNTKFKPEGQSREFRDTAYSWNPRLRCDQKTDFAGEVPYYEVNAPLMATASGINTIPTTSTSKTYITVPRGGVLAGASITTATSLAIDGTNYVTFTATNVLGAGSGTTVMLAAASTDNTTFTGGVAITAKKQYALTISATAANLRVAEGDVIEVVATVTGTLSGALVAPQVRLRFSTIQPPMLPLKPRITRTAGSPLVGQVANTPNGEAILQLSATSEVNVAALDFGDQLVIPATRAPVFTARVKISGVAASTRFVFGFVSAYNATFDTTTNNLWFRLEGNDLSLLTETDDNTTNRDDNDTTRDLVADTYYLLRVDAKDTGNVKFYLDDDLVATMNASALAVTDLLQPIIAIQKDTGTGAQTVTIDSVRVSWNRV